MIFKYFIHDFINFPVTFVFYNYNLISLRINSFFIIISKFNLNFLDFLSLLAGAVFLSVFAYFDDS